jgi:hypothetical protein
MRYNRHVLAYQLVYSGEVCLNVPLLLRETEEATAKGREGQDSA